MHNLTEYEKKLLLNYWVVSQPHWIGPAWQVYDSQFVEDPLYGKAREQLRKLEMVTSSHGHGPSRIKFGRTGFLYLPTQTQMAAGQHADLIMKAVKRFYRDNQGKSTMLVTEIQEKTKLEFTDIYQTLPVLAELGQTLFPNYDGKMPQDVNDAVSISSTLGDYISYGDLLARRMEEHKDNLKTVKFGLPVNLNDIAGRQQAAPVPVKAKTRATPTPKPSTIWAPARYRLFLSHVSDEKKQVSLIKTALADLGFSAFVAHEDIEPTKEWENVILEALETCHGMAALLTKTFHKSNWTNQEIGYCIKRKVPILTVRLGIDPYGFVGRFQGLPGSEKPLEVAEQIFDVLVKDVKAGPILAAAMLDLFVTCRNYKISHRYLDRLEALENYLSAVQLDQIGKAVKTNTALKAAYGMVDKVKAFLDKRKPLV